MKAIFLRAIEEPEDKGRVLRAAIASPDHAKGQTLFDVRPATFGQVPRSPFAYWAPESVLMVFCTLPALGRRSLVASGTGTLNDFRFLRLSWEVFGTGTWFCYAKGGAFSPFYYDHHLMVSWSNDGAEMKAWIVERYGGGHWARNIRSTEHYFRPGLTWPRRTNGLSFRVMPAGFIFADKGPAVFLEGDTSRDLLSLCALVNSAPFGALVGFQLARTELAQSFEVGVIQQTPIPPQNGQSGPLSNLARESWALQRSLDTPNENSHAFHLPALLQVDGRLLSERADAWGQNVADIEAKLARMQVEIDDRCFELYGIVGADRERIERGLGGSSALEESADANDNEEETTEPEEIVTAQLVGSLLSWSVGVAFGRFDLRLATGERVAPLEPEPFDPLPVCSPGMLTGEDGLPLDTPPARLCDRLPPRRHSRRRRWHAARSCRFCAPGLRARLRRPRCPLGRSRRDPRSARPHASPVVCARLLRAPSEAVFQEPPQGSDLLAALHRIRLLHRLALLPSAHRRHALPSGRGAPGTQDSKDQGGAAPDLTPPGGEPRAARQQSLPSRKASWPSWSRNWKR